jgi:glycosyl transferase family 87
VPSCKSHPLWGKLSAVASDPGGGDAPTAADRGIALTFVLVSAGATALVTARKFSTPNRAGLLALAFAAFALALGVGRWRRALSMRTVVIVTAALLVVGVNRWPRDSTDIWSYAAYGRMVSVYGASPYRHVPVEFSNDRAIRRVKPMWQNTSSVYGPLWNEISAGVVSVTRTNSQSTRMWFQSLAALSVFLAVLLIARRTRSPVAAALIGLNPLIIYDVVNGGHNDALVGLAILVGVLLASRERFALAALAIALGALVKLVALLGLVALIVWILRKRGVRPAAIATAVGGGVVAVGYALSGGLDALTPLRDARLQMSRNSIWLLSNSEGRTNLFGFGRVHQFSHDFLQSAATLSAITVFLLAAVLVAGHLRRTCRLPAGRDVRAALVRGVGAPGARARVAFDDDAPRARVLGAVPRRLPIPAGRPPLPDVQGPVRVERGARLLRDRNHRHSGRHGRASTTTSTRTRRGGRSTDTGTGPPRLTLS